MNIFNQTLYTIDKLPKLKNALLLQAEQSKQLHFIKTSPNERNSSADFQAMEHNGGQPDNPFPLEKRRQTEYAHKIPKTLSKYLKIHAIYVEKITERRAYKSVPGGKRERSVGPGKSWSTSLGP